jgi:hypothetical protein
MVWHNHTVVQMVNSHLLHTRIKKQDAYQELIVLEVPNDPNSSTRFFTTSRLKDTLEQVVTATPNAGPWKPYLRILKN